MKNVVLFSGLGADQRVFDFLDLGDVSRTFIQWLRPEPDETLPEYAKRLLVQIAFENPILIGVSFGGMVATEISKLIPTEKVIIISSASSHHAIPLYYKIIGKLRLHHLIPPGMTKRPGKFLCKVLGIEQQEHQSLICKILGGTDPVFLRRALSMILQWRNEQPPSNFYHIHGTKDWLLPLIVKCNYTINGGGHFMIVNRATEVSNCIQAVIHAA